MRVLLLVVSLVLVGAPGMAEEEPYTQTASCAWDRAVLRVGIVPSPTPSLVEPSTGVLPDGVDTPWSNAYTRATLAAIQSWEDALHATAPHLAAVHFDARVLAPGEEDAAFDPDVRIHFVPHLGLFAGLAYTTCLPANSTPTIPCPEDPDAPCAFAGANVFISTTFLSSFSDVDVHNIVLHEFGHALGLDHVEAPLLDNMYGGYPYDLGDPSTPTRCPSNLNLAQLAVSYEWLQGSPFRYRPAGVHVPVEDYSDGCPT